jgi:alanyl-tRNA synthetase
VGAGLRRIEAITGTGLMDHLQEVEGRLEETAAVLKAGPHDLVQRVTDLVRQLRESQKELEVAQDRLRAATVGGLVAGARSIGNTSVLVAKVEAPDAESLRRLGDLVREALGSGVLVLGAASADRVQFLAMATADAVNRGIHCGHVVKEAAAVAGGGGGGRADMAQAGGRDPAKLKQALDRASEVIAHQLRTGAV